MTGDFPEITEIRSNRSAKSEKFESTTCSIARLLPSLKATAGRFLVHPAFDREQPDNRLARGEVSAQLAGRNFSQRRTEHTRSISVATGVVVA